MFTDEQIVYVLKKIKKEKLFHAENLHVFVRTHFNNRYHSYFFKHIEDMDYINHDDSQRYFVTKKGRSLIWKQNIVQFAKNPILVLILIIIPTILSILFNWDKVIKLFEK